MNQSDLAHPGGPLYPHDLWRAWNFDPWLLIPLILTILIYGWGLWKVWQRAGVGRGISLRRLASFVAAVLALILALVSPLDDLSEVLFSAHMTQHMILMLVAAPLLVISNFPLALLGALRRPSARALAQGVNHSQPFSLAWQFLNKPVSAWSLFALMLWVWHAPRLYEAALQDETLHTFEHLIFLATAMLFWWVLFKQTTQKHLHYGMAILYLFTTVLHSGVLGALMTFTSEPWYPYYAPLVSVWGLTPLQDQQLAGLIMWIPGGAVFSLLTIGYFAAWLNALERRSLRLRHRDFLPPRQETN
jgi:putative membrane protein